MAAQKEIALACGLGHIPGMILNVLGISERWRRWTADDATAWRCLLAATFSLAFSLPLGRILLVLALILLVGVYGRRRCLPRVPLVGWLALIYVLLAVRATLYGINPEQGVPKLSKLAWFVAIPIYGVLATDRARIRALLSGFVLGAGVLALYTLSGQLCETLSLVREGLFTRAVDAWVHTGSMTQAQRFMVGALLGLGILLSAPGRVDTLRRWAWAGLVGLLLVGLVAQFKRGSWFATLLMAPVFALVRGRWRWALGVGLLALGLLAVPAVRDRLLTLRHEFTDTGGGRMTMWTSIAPALVREYPWGAGYRSLTNEAMRAIDRRVEPNRDHLHSNFVQVLVDVGWLGLAVYLLWMGTGLAQAGRRTWRARGQPDAPLALAALLALLALILNGVVEYNLGDGEIVLIYGLLLGIAASRAPLVGQAGDGLAQGQK